MRKIIVLTFLAISLLSCAPSGNTNPSTSGTDVYFWHDDSHRVSCWLYGNVGTSGKSISCIPDWQLERP